MANEHDHDLLILGAGPGGYVAAIRAAQLGMNVGIVDKEKALGGTCLRVGCIPSKALLESSEKYEEAGHALKAHGVDVGSVKLDLKAMLKRKDGVVDQLTKGVGMLMKKNKAKVYNGFASFADPHTVAVTDPKGKTSHVTAQRIVIATGSKPATLPGVDLDMDKVDTSTEAIDYDAVPEHLAVIGGGYIGLELGSVWRRLGSKVTVVEYLDRLLPGMDAGIAKEAHKMLKKQGLLFELKSKVTGVKPAGDKMVIERDGGDPIEADRVLVAVGRKPMTDGLNLEAIGVATDKRGYIPVDHDFKTSADSVYAIGDVIPTAMLAHVAEEEGVACVEKIVTGAGHVPYDAIPAVVYTHPEIASVGQTEEQLKDAGIAYATGKFPFMANGRAKAIAQTDGFVKVLADKATDRVLGVHIIGPHAGDLIAECATAMTFGASSEDIARACHAHPTLSEAVKEACFDVEGRVVHM
ncbi:MAG: dihydrolipoyl dehydrogenase [Planctomycetota bacterium]